MNYVSSVKSASVTGRFKTMVSHVLDTREKRAQYMRTVRELSRLDDRELTDLGINRYSIEEVARKHTYEA